MTLILQRLFQSPLTLRPVLSVVPAQVELSLPYEVVGSELGLDHPQSRQHEQHPGPAGHEQVVLEVLEVVFLVGQPDQEGGHVGGHLRRGGGRAVLLLQHAVIQRAWHHNGTGGCIGIEIGAALGGALGQFVHLVGAEEGEDLVEACVEAAAVVLDARRQRAVVGLNCGVFVDVVALDDILACQVAQVASAVVTTVSEPVRQSLGDCLRLHVCFEFFGGE